MGGVMQRDPVLIPRKPGVFALVNKSRRCAYVAFSSDLQKRSHSLAHMLQNPETHWSIKELPQHPAGEYTFTVVADDVDEKRAERLIKHCEKEFSAKKYRVVAGSRGAVPLVTLKGETMSLSDAIKKAKCKQQYITVWRRLYRGWTIEQALDLAPAPPRWDPAETAARRKRAAKNGHG